jgi:hypothetical protein
VELYGCCNRAISCCKELFRSEWEPDTSLKYTRKLLFSRLNGIEIGVSQALVRTTACELGNLIESMGGVQASPLAGYQLPIVNGNCIAETEHRLAVTRQTTTAVLPGKSRVILGPQLGLAVDVFPCEDGHAQERRLFDGVLSMVQAGEV